MPHEFLQRFEIRSVLEHMHCERITDNMRRQLVTQFRLFSVFLQDLPQSLPRHSVPVEINEQRLFLFFSTQQLITCLINIVFQRCPRRSSQRNDPGMTLFTGTRDKAHTHIDILKIRSDQLTDADPGSVKHLQDSTIPHPANAVIRHCHQLFDFRHFQIFNGFTLNLWRLDILRRIGFHHPRMDQIMKKRPQ